jgi:uncharacterized protein YdaU (DUF1376 family)
MAEYPALPLFTDAFLADTLHLTAAQTGAYLMLLMVAWRTTDCSLPDDDIILAKYARMDKRAWAVNKSVIMSFWTKTDDCRWMQKRLKDERKIADARRDQAIRAGKSSALKRKDRHSTDATTERQRNVNYPKPKPTYYPQTPKPSEKDNSTHDVIKGVFKNGGLGGGYKIENLLSDDAWQDARSHAPGWDIHHLASVYCEKINSGERDPPVHPNKAFPLWCKAYTKGVPPK